MGNLGGRPRKLRVFTASAFTKMIAGQVYNKVRKDIPKQISIENAKHIMRDAIEEGMYKQYTPVLYMRREKHNGLLSMNNMIVSYMFRADASNSTNPLLQKYNFTVRIANKAKPAPLYLSSLMIAYSTKRSITTLVNPEIKHTNVDDLLYYWKDQGLVYNLFNDPNFSSWGRPMHFNDIIHRKFFDEGRLHNIFGYRFKRKLKSIKINADYVERKSKK